MNRAKKDALQSVVQVRKPVPHFLRQSRWGPIVCSLFSAALLTLCYPLPDMGPLVFVALVPWTLATIFSQRPIAILVGSYVAAFGFFLINLFWLWPVTGPGYVALAFYLGFYWPAASFLVRRLIRRRIPCFITLPVVWVSLEYLRSYLLTGFPWFYLGHTQHRFITLIQISDLFGAYGVSFLVGMVNGALVDVLGAAWMNTTAQRGNSMRIIAPAATSLMLVIALGYGSFRLSQKTTSAGPLVGMVQENVPQRVKDSSGSFQQIFDAHMRLSAQAAEQGAELIAWPETMVPFYLNRSFLEYDTAALLDGNYAEQHWAKVVSVMNELDGALREFAKERRVYLLLGASSMEGGRLPPDGNEDKYNSAYLYNSDGQVGGRYDKNHLVPFGEVVPFRQSIPWLYNLLNKLTPYGGIHYSLAPGKELTVLEIEGRDGKHYGLAALICFEDVMPYLCRRAVINAQGQKCVDLLVNISNDGWFNGSSELPQHLAICVFRAVENRVPIARAVNTGISALIDSTGRVERVVETSGGNRRAVSGVLVGQVRPDARLAPYSRIGDIEWVLLLSLLGLELLSGAAKSMYHARSKAR